MQGFYILVFILAAGLALEPELTIKLLRLTFLKMDVWFINLRTKYAAWCIYRGLVKTCKENGFPEPGPFVYVDIWDRKR